MMSTAVVEHGEQDGSLSLSSHARTDTLRETIDSRKEDDDEEKVFNLILVLKCLTICHYVQYTKEKDQYSKSNSTCRANLSLHSK